MSNFNGVSSRLADFDHRLYVCAFFDRRHDDSRVRSRHTRNGAQAFGDQAVEAFRIFRDDFQEVRVRACDVMAFQNVRQRENPFRKLGIELGMINAYADEGRDVFAELAPINSRRIAGNEAFLFELAHPLGNSRLG